MEKGRRVEQGREELAVVLKERFGEMGIDHAIFDLDGTLIKTRDLFDRQISEFYELISHSLPSDLTSEGFEGAVRDIVVDIRDKWKVSPGLWQGVIERLSEQYNIGIDFLKENMSPLLEIYEKAPELKEGALQTLDIFRQAGIEMAVLTHSSAEWAEIKLRERGLDFYFGDDVYTVDVNVSKGATHWVQTIDELGVNPKRVLVIGDNIEADILAAYQAGVIYLIYVEAAWDAFKDGDLPEGVFQVEKLGEIPGVFLNREI